MKDREREKGKDGTCGNSTIKGEGNVRAFVKMDEEVRPERWEENPSGCWGVTKARERENARDENVTSDNSSIVQEPWI